MEGEHSHGSKLTKDALWCALVFASTIVLAWSVLSAAGMVSASIQANTNATAQTALLLQAALNGAPAPSAAAAAAPTAAPSAPSAKFSLSGEVFRGSENAKVTIVEFSDFQCPYCARAEGTMQQLLSDYAGKIRLYYRQFPLPFHENALAASEASECAGEQGKFWEYHDKLFENQGALDSANLKKYAGALGLDQKKFDTCLDTGAKKAQVVAETQEGENNGVSGTPAFFINGQLVSGAQPLSVFKQVIDAELAG
ncbi:MAG: DsbA family protein [Candidatus Micrarchaeia archaeon]|jgi:protein-disulfide isomerase